MALVTSQNIADAKTVLDALVAVENGGGTQITPGKLGDPRVPRYARAVKEFLDFFDAELTS